MPTFSPSPPRVASWGPCRRNLGAAHCEEEAPPRAPGLVLPPPGPCSCSQPPPSLSLFLQTPALACLGFTLPDPAPAVSSCCNLRHFSVTLHPVCPLQAASQVAHPADPPLGGSSLPIHLPRSALPERRHLGGVRAFLFCSQPGSLLASRPQTPIRIYWNLPPVLILQPPRAWAWLPPPWSA